MHVYRPSKRHRKWWVQFKDHRGLVRRVPGDRAKGTATTIGAYIEQLVRARAHGDPPPVALVDWIANMPRDLADRLVSFSLLDRRRTEQTRPLYFEVTADRTARHELIPIGKTPEGGAGAGGGWPTILSEWRQDLIDSGNGPAYAQEAAHYVRRLFAQLRVAYLVEIAG